MFHHAQIHTTFFWKLNFFRRQLHSVFHFLWLLVHYSDRVEVSRQNLWPTRPQILLSGLLGERLWREWLLFAGAQGQWVVDCCASSVHVGSWNCVNLSFVLLCGFEGSSLLSRQTGTSPKQSHCVSEATEPFDVQPTLLMEFSTGLVAGIKGSSNPVPSFIFEKIL